MNSKRIDDLIAPLHRFPVATDRIVGLSPTVGRVVLLQLSRLGKCRPDRVFVARPLSTIRLSHSIRSVTTGTQ